MDEKGTKPWDESNELDTIELTNAPGGAAGNKTISNQSGGDESAPAGDLSDSEPSGAEELA